jgi:hypothetical protein
MCLRSDEGTAVPPILWGYMTFRPSDIVGGGYNLRLKYPPEIRFEGKTIQLEVLRDSSGCQFVHRGLEHKPHEWTDEDGLRVAEISVTEPLTDMHQLKFTWKGDVTVVNAVKA